MFSSVNISRLYILCILVLAVCMSACESSAEKKIEAHKSSTGSGEKYNLEFAIPEQPVISDQTLDFDIAMKVGKQQINIPMVMKIKTKWQPVEGAQNKARGTLESISGKVMNIEFSSDETVNVEGVVDDKPQNQEQAVRKQLHEEVKKLCELLVVDVDLKQGLKAPEYRFQNLDTLNSSEMGSQILSQMKNKDEVISQFLGVLQFMPEEEVGEGAKWTVMHNPGQYDIGDIPVLMTLEQVDTSGEDKIAIMALEAYIEKDSIEIDTPQGKMAAKNLDLALTGKLHFNITKGREIKNDQHIDMTFEAEEQGQKIKAEMNMNVATKRVYLEEE